MVQLSLLSQKVQTLRMSQHFRFSVPVLRSCYLVGGGCSTPATSLGGIPG